MNIRKKLNFKLTTMSTKKPYTEDQIRYILENYVKKEDSCVRETGHSLGSIKLMLQNIAATYGLVNFGTGNPIRTKRCKHLARHPWVTAEILASGSIPIKSLINSCLCTAAFLLLH